MAESHWISPSHTSRRFPGYPFDLTIEEEITILKDRILGWYLDIAARIAEHSPSLYEGRSGFAELAIVTSYFETIAKFKSGYCGDASERFFVSGFRAVWDLLRNKWIDIPGFQPENETWVTQLAAFLYKALRCEMYHATGIGPGIELTGSIDYPLVLEISSDRDLTKVRINSEKFTRGLIRHFNHYTTLLENSSEQQLRANFRTRWRHLHTPNRFTWDKK
jgi:hypothetical protein